MKNRIPDRVELPARTLRPEQVLEILEIMDSFNLHREAILVPLATQEKGSVTVLSDGRLRIICPSEGFDEWVHELQGHVRTLDLFGVRKRQGFS